MQVFLRRFGRVGSPLHVVSAQHRDHHQLDHVGGDEASWAHVFAGAERQIVRVGGDELPLAAAVFVRRLMVLLSLAVPPQAVEDVRVGCHSGISANVVGGER